MQKLDAHVHFWQLSRGDYPWMKDQPAIIRRDYGPQDFSPLAERCEISGHILVQAAATYDETCYLLDLAARQDCIAGVIGWVDIENMDSSRTQLEALAGNDRFLGIRPMLRDMRSHSWFDAAALETTVETLVDLDSTFECMVRPAELDRLGAFLQRYPTLRAVLCHAGMPDIAKGDYSNWADGITRLAAETSICCKLSGLTTLAGDNWNGDTLRPWFEHLLAQFGPERLIWGSDWPVMLGAGSYEDWCTACDKLLGELEQVQQQAIYKTNAMNVYRIGEHL